NRGLVGGQDSCRPHVFVFERVIIHIKKRIHQLGNGRFGNRTAMRPCYCYVRLAFVEEGAIPVNFDPVRWTSSKACRSRECYPKSVPVTNRREWYVRFWKQFG